MTMLLCALLSATAAFEPTFPMSHTLRKSPSRGVTMNQGATELLATMGLEDRMPGRADLDNKNALNPVACPPWWLPVLLMQLQQAPTLPPSPPPSPPLLPLPPLSPNPPLGDAVNIIGYWGNSGAAQGRLPRIAELHPNYNVVILTFANLADSGELIFEVQADKACCAAGAAYQSMDDLKAELAAWKVAPDPWGRRRT
eukprot:scaffold79658_cov66-Phaeocystis_antarctica.AAC.1